MLFKAISGHVTLKKHLLTALETTSATFLFNGPTGSANLALALAYTTYLHCSTPSSIDACNQCNSCMKMERLTHPDLHFAFPIGPTHQIKGKEVNTTNFLEQWRSFLIKNPYGNLQDWSRQLQDKVKNLQIGKLQTRHIKQIASLKAFESKYKIILIWLPELLHHAASNALLKILEEPPKQTVFILVATNSTQLLPTIHSRTLKIYVPSSSHKVKAKNYSHSTATQHTSLVKGTQGKLNKTENLTLNHTESYFEKLVQWLRATYLQNWTSIVNFAENFYILPLQVQKNWISYSLQIMRSTLLTYFHQADLVKLNKKELTFCQKLSKTLVCNQVVDIIQTLEKSHYALQRNANGKLLLLNTSLHIAQLIHPKR